MIVLFTYISDISKITFDIHIVILYICICKYIEYTYRGLVSQLMEVLSMAMTCYDHE